MTPAINIAKKQKITFRTHQYTHEQGQTTSYGQEAAEKLGVDAKLVFKTLVVQLDGTNRLAVAVTPVCSMLNMKLTAKAAGAKKATMADKKTVEKTTGYVLGGVSPLGQKKRLTTIIDISAHKLSTIYVSAGRRGLEIELQPADLAALTSATFAEISKTN